MIGMNFYISVFADPRRADVPQVYTEVVAKHIDRARKVLKASSQFVYCGSYTCDNTGGHKANRYILGSSVEVYSYLNEKRIDIRGSHLGDVIQTAEQFLELPRPQKKDILFV